MLVRIIIIGIIVYLLVRFVLDFLIPVYRTTRQVKNQMNEFMNRQQEQAGNAGNTSEQKSTTKEDISGEYIDFEEVKEKNKR